MMLGPIVNGSAVIVGSVFGASLGEYINENLRTKLNLVFGVCSMTLGIVMIVKLNKLPPVILATLIGSIVGELIRLEAGIQYLGNKAKIVIEKIVKPREGASEHDFAERFVPAMVLFCASGTGIFGAMSEGMTGDTTLLMVKSFLDLFTSAIFATTLGYTLAVSAIPQFFIQGSLFLLASYIMPLTTPTMIADFSAAGGIIMLATGFRICGLKPFAVANMLPSLLIIMPISSLWLRYVG
jgi:hypothetical protein